jgi:hypothetical protein
MCLLDIKSMEHHMKPIQKLVLSSIFAASLSFHGIATARDDYPTVTLVDYVYGCMKANGNTRDSLERCSCSIDVISSIISYADYEGSETFKSLSLLTGERGTLFRQTAPARQAAATLKRAQAEAEVRCF